MQNTFLDGQITTPRFTLWIYREVSASGVSDWFLDRSTFKTDLVEQAMKFAPNTVPTDALCARFFSFIEGYLPVAVNRGGLSARDAEFMGQGVLLKNVFVSINDAQAGVQRVMVVFRHVIGSITPLFQERFASKSMSDLKSTLATKVLADLVLPMLNLAAFQNMSGTQLESRAREHVLAYWGEKEAELRFYTDLIARYAETLDGDPGVVQQIPTIQGIPVPEQPKSLPEA